MGLHADIGTLGDVAAEQDGAVLSYFLKTDAVTQIENGRAIVVLGRKGSGKTALAKYFSRSSDRYLSTALSLRDYPWGVHQKRKNMGASEIESYVSSWRYLIAVKTLALLINEKGMRLQTDCQRAANVFLTDNYGGPNPGLGDVLKPTRLKLSKASFLPSVMGNSIGGVDFETKDGGVAAELDVLTDALIQCAMTICSQTGVKRVLLHFDELDQGLSIVDKQHEQMIVGLILAARSYQASNNKDIGIHPIAYLRTDIWDELKFSDKNKISQSTAVLLEWDSDTLLSLVNERIRVKLGPNYEWGDIEDGALMRGSQSKWNHIVSRTFLRPRDVIQFLNCALAVSLSRMAGADEFDNGIFNRRESHTRDI